jgi:hypothetical protein
MAPPAAGITWPRAAQVVRIRLGTAPALGSQTESAGWGVVRFLLAGVSWLG